MVGWCEARRGDQLNLLVFAWGQTDDRATAEAARLRLMPLPIPAADANANAGREAPCLIMQTVEVPIKRTVSGWGTVDEEPCCMELYLLN